MSGVSRAQVTLENTIPDQIDTLCLHPFVVKAEAAQCTGCGGISNQVDQV